jgi:hypothetical protein
MGDYTPMVHGDRTAFVNHRRTKVAAYQGERN